jgi:hypothetical protein
MTGLIEKGYQSAPRFPRRQITFMDYALPGKDWSASNADLHWIANWKDVIQVISDTGAPYRVVRRLPEAFKDMVSGTSTAVSALSIASDGLSCRWN